MTSNTPRPRSHISPSRVGDLFEYGGCERRLRFDAAPAELRDGLGIADLPARDSMAQAALQRGIAHEEAILQRLLDDGRVTIPEGEGPISQRRFTADLTPQVLASAEPGTFVAQSCLSAPEPLYQRYGIDADRILLSDCYPDLIEVRDEDGERVLRVIDAKAARDTKFGYRVQVTMYALILDALREAHDLPWRVDLRWGGLWLAGDTEPTLFDIRTLIPPLEAFLREDLRRVLVEGSPETDRWSLGIRCESCRFFDRCRPESDARDRLSRISSLTPHAVRALETWEPPVTTVDELRTRLEDSDVEAALATSASLRGRRERLRRQVQALQDGQPRAYGAASTVLPAWEHVRIVLSVHREPFSGRVYAAGLFYQGLKDGDEPLLPTGTTRTLVWVADSEDEILGIQRRFLTQLWDIFELIDVFNAEHEYLKPAKTLQVYMVDSHERHELEDMLIGLREDVVVGSIAQGLLHYLYSGSLIQDEAPPQEPVATAPVVALMPMVRALFALGTPYTETFDAASAGLPNTYYDPPPVTTTGEAFRFAFSNRLRSDTIYELWQSSDGVIRNTLHESLESEIRRRLQGARNLVEGIRRACEEQGLLVCRAPYFRLPDAAYLENTQLARLAFVAEHERWARFLALRGRRGLTAQERVAANISGRVRYLGDDRFEVLEESLGVRWKEGFFNPYLLHRVGEAAGEREMQAFHDILWPNPRMNRPIDRVTIIDLPSHDNGHVLRLGRQYRYQDRWVSAAIRSGKDIPGLGCLQPGDELELNPMVFELTSHSLQSELREMDASPPRRLLDLLAPPITPGPSAVPSSVAARALAFADAMGLGQSQRAALEAMLTQDLALVWGPPGTGKSYLLALALLLLARACAEARLTLRIMLTAFTREASLNVLRLITELRDEHDLDPSHLSLGWLSGNEPLPAGVSEVDQRRAESWMARQPGCVLLSGTIWRLRKDPSLSPFDLVVIDEGSQLKVAEAAVAIRRMKEDGTLVVCGDHKQLPAIVQGDYPDPVPGEVPLASSLFNALLEVDGHDSYVTMLEEGWRLNAVLNAWPARQLYSEAYRPANSAVATRRLDLRADTGDDELARLALDPEAPLVIGIVSGVQALAENAVEARLAARLTLALRERLQVDAQALPEGAEGDERFAERVFLSSPHHAQNDVIMEALDALREWAPRPRVGTVDVVQGQTVDAAVISYGVSDPELALREGEFLYSAARLNVAMTRARAKAIILISDCLLSPDLSIYRDEAVAEGVAFMRGLVDFASHGDRHDLDLGGGARLRLLCRGFAGL